METAIIIVILAVIIGSVIWYLVRAKKRGQTCIGCPYSKQCNGGCGQHGNEHNDSSQE